jgi:hypothetical protein
MDGGAMEFVNGKYVYTMASLLEDIKLGRGPFGWFKEEESEELYNFLDAYRESRTQAMISVGHRECEWLESHEWWPN